MVLIGCTVYVMFLFVAWSSLTNQTSDIVLRIQVFWDVMLCFWVSSSQNFEVLWCIHLQV